MRRKIRPLTAAALLAVAVVAAVLISGVVPLDFAASEMRDTEITELRIQARQTESGRVEVRAQSSIAGQPWMLHTPRNRFLPAEPEPGRWYSSDILAIDPPDVSPIPSPGRFTQILVRAAINRYERDGRETTLQYYNSEESVDRQWYVFIFDEDETLIAHENSELLGLTAAEVNGPDGYPAGRMILAAASAKGAWVDYQFNNPATGHAEIKHSWVVRHDGLIFGSGWYEAAPSKTHMPGAFTQSFLDRALEMYRVLGREATLEYYNSPDSVDGQWYVFIIASDGTRLAHPLLPVGVNILDGDPDPTGYHYRPDIVGVEDRDWISYIFNNPERDQLERKHTWLVRRHGLIFAAGYYVEGAYEAPES